MPEKKVQLIVQHSKVAVLDLEGNFMKLFKVSVSYQKEMAAYLRENNFRITKEAAACFPYLECFS